MSCKPVLNGILWSLGNSQFNNGKDWFDASQEEWIAEFDAMRHLGLDTLMLFTGMDRAMNRTAEAAPDIIERIAGECDRCGMSLIVATGTHPLWWRELKMPDEMKLIGRTVDWVCERCLHHLSFAGWYIDYEFQIKRGELGAALKELFRETVSLCRSKTPKLPVVASPFFCPPTETNILDCGDDDPEEYYEYWSDFIACTRFDALALQDNGGQHLSFFEESDTEPYIAAFARACRENGCRFWGNVETGEFEIGSAREFTDLYGVHGNVNRILERWRAVPIERLKRKLVTMSRYSEKNLSWGYQPFYRPGAGPAAAAAYRAYEAYLKESCPEMIR